MRNIPIVCIFGRPGSGKSTIASSAVHLFHEDSILALDLDDCVPDWMRDNFQKGLYPTLEQRRDFAETACDHVQASMDASTAQLALVAFSFVNADLREAFRLRFPTSQWILIDTSDEEAQRRIERRQGHFFKGRAQAEDRELRAATPDNSEWNFAPVDLIIYG